jgi:NAD(P)-dependent dehydrogenase (short-subunit alcohol dehydrogenase family)
MTIRFDDRVAVITGAGAGLGRSHALALAARGAKVVVNDPAMSRHPGAEGQRAADQVVAEIRAAGGEAIANHDSIAEMVAAQRLIDQAVSHYGKIDILVNNAGVLRDKTLAKMEMADWDLVLKVHLSGTAYCTRAAWPEMQKNKYGRIVFTTSNAGLYGSFGQANYSAAKMGMLGLMNTLRQEGLKHNILVNTIAPVAATNMTEGILPTDIAPHFRPEHASAAVMVMCSETFPHSGQTCSAAAGHYSLVYVTCSVGRQFDPSSVVSPETLWEAWEGVTNRNGLRTFSHAAAETEAILESIAQRQRGAPSQ